MLSLLQVLGKNQDTLEKRIHSWKKKGYQKGQPDIMILSNHQEYNGFCIEFKSPTNNYKITKEQLEMHFLALTYYIYIHVCYHIWLLLQLNLYTKEVENSNEIEKKVSQTWVEVLPVNMPQQGWGFLTFAMVKS